MPCAKLHAHLLSVLCVVTIIGKFGCTVVKNVPVTLITSTFSASSPILVRLTIRVVNICLLCFVSCLTSNTRGTNIALVCSMCCKKKGRVLSENVFAVAPCPQPTEDLLYFRVRRTHTGRPVFDDDDETSNLRKIPNNNNLNGGACHI